MILEIRVTWKDYLNAMRLHMRPRPSLIMAGLVLGVLSVLVYGYIVVSVFKAALTVVSVFPVWLLFGCFISWYFIYLPNKASKIYSQQKALQAPFSLELVADGLNYTSEVANGDLTWDYFPKWKENKRLFRIYHSDDLFQMVPKRFLKDAQELAAFKAALTSNVKKTR